MATIKDVARLAGMSPATVSRVINQVVKVSPESEQKIQAAIKTLNFHPNANARALVKKDSNMLGVVISELADPFFASMANAIESTAKKHKLNVLISTGSLDVDREYQAIERLISHRCNAMVVNSKVLPDEVLIDFANKIPGFVLINKYIEAIKHRCVWLDNVKGGYTMADYAISLGHESILVLSTQDKQYDASRRLSGIRQAFTDNNLSFKSDMLMFDTPDYAGGQAAIKSALNSHKKFTLVLAYNDAMAAGALSQLHSSGYKVPEQISIIGFDDILQAKYCSPNLTTIRYPITVMATRATQLALDLSRQTHQVNTQFTFKYEPILIKRSTTLAP